MQSTEYAITATATNIKNCSLFSVYCVLATELRAFYMPVMQALRHFYTWELKTKEGDNVPQRFTEMRGRSGILTQPHWAQSRYGQPLSCKASIFTAPMGYFIRGKSRTIQWIEHMSFFSWVRTEGTKIEKQFAEKTKNNLHLPAWASYIGISR